MSSALQSLPQTGRGFGLQFNYENWTEGTVATLVNVPWNNDYRDIVSFASTAALDAWIDGRENIVVEKMSLGKMLASVKISTPYNAAMRFNYLRVENPLMPIQGDVQRNYYYFITGLNFLAPNATELILQLDVWQTFGREVSFGSCYVERGHIGIANSNAFNHYGRDYLAEPEGLDIGGEYRVVHTAGDTIMAPAISGTDHPCLLVCTTIDMTVDPGEYGTRDDPKLVAAKGSVFQNMPTAAGFYLFKTGGDFLAWLTEMGDRPWVTQGILSVTLVPDPNRYYPGFIWRDVSPDTVDTPFYDVPLDYPGVKQQALHVGWRTSGFTDNILGPRYKGLKKFLTSPYLIIELTTWTGSPVIIRPEMWQDADATVREMCALMPPGQRIAIMPYRYNWDAETTVSNNIDPAFTQHDDDGEFLDVAAVIGQFPQMPVVNDMGIAYLAANRNSLAFGASSAEWSQQRALAGNQTSYDQASNAIVASNNTSVTQQQQIGTATHIGTQAVAQHATVQAIGQAVGGGMGGSGVSAAGGLAQGAATAVSAAITNDAMTRQGALAIDTNARLGNIQRYQMGYVRDTNRSLADWAARGDYSNTIAGINAKMQDARMTQPSVSGQFNGDAFNLVNGYFGFSARWKMPNLHALRAIGDYWLRYGYSVRQFMTVPTNLLCMTKFTYWKLTETYISQGAFPEGFKQIIRGIFEKGVTVWADPAFIGTTDWADNEPVDGISY